MGFDFKSILGAVGDVALSFIPGASPVLKGLSAVAKVIGGDAGKKIESGISTMAEGLAEVSKKPLSPEQQVELDKAKMETEVELKEIAYKEKKLDYDDQAGGRDVVKTALMSEDPVVRQARPRMMTKLGNSCIAFAFVAPAIIILGGLLKLEQNILTQVVSTIQWVGGFLFSSFMTSFTGYTVSRGVEKVKLSGNNAPKSLDMLAKLGRKIS